MCLVDTRARACIVQGMSHLETRPDNMLVTVDCGVPLVMREGRIRERRGEERRRERRGCVIIQPFNSALNSCTGMGNDIRDPTGMNDEEFV